MTWSLLLWLWTGIGLAWWVIAHRLVSGASGRRPSTGPEDRRQLSIFKSLARGLSEIEFKGITRCLESFVAELDEDSELLIGCHVTDRGRMLRFFEDMEERHPGADIKLVVRSDPDRFPHPKVSWMHVLARHATGELWLWSDADITAPEGTLRSLRADFAKGGARFVTSPYAVVEGTNTSEMLDTLYVNLEFYPGVVLLDRLDQIRFGFGSAMLFEADEFRRRIDWHDLGGHLAEDYHLGQEMAPVRLGSMRLTTLPSDSSWWIALLHYLRWQKTVRWNRPGSFAGQLVIQPALGWLVWLAVDPGNPAAWLGLLAVLAIDTGAAFALCRAVGCRIGWHRAHVVPLWSLIRALTWLACWLPWPIVWRGRRWWSAHRATRRDRAHEESPPAEVISIRREPSSTSSAAS
jgi:ceramide glucosyltransferase